jgi:acyl dehydratase
VGLNAELVGKEYPPVRYQVGREKLREFAAAVGETDPLYCDLDAARAAGFDDLPAVPTFPVVLSYQVGQVVYDDPDLGVDYSRVVHGEQSFEYTRPVVAGDQLVATGRIAAMRARGRHQTLTVETIIETEAGEPVCRTSSTIVVRGADPAPSQGDAVAAAEPSGAQPVGS